MTTTHDLNAISTRLAVAVQALRELNQRYETEASYRESQRFYVICDQHADAILSQLPSTNPNIPQPAS